MLQKQHKKELSEITKWWKDLDFANKLPFARDRIVEFFFWILGVYFEPQYAMGRRILTKVISMTSTVDDIYDVYTIEELELFTSAIESWDMSAIDELPEYMKYAYGPLLDVDKEIEKDMTCQGKLYRLHYAKEMLERQREHIPSSIECYAKQHGVSEEEEAEVLLEEVENAWKDLNEELRLPTIVPMPLLEQVLNLTRVIYVLYDAKEGDSYTHSYLVKDKIALMLKDPVTL